MCGCLEKIRTDIIKSGNANYVRIDCSTILQKCEGQPDKENITGQRIELGYTHTKRNGEKVNKERKSFITHVFCPFCGIQY